MRIYVVINTHNPSEYYLFKEHADALTFEAFKPIGKFEIEVKELR